MMKENNTSLPETTQTPETNPTTSEKHGDDRFSYMEQKPQHNRKALVMLGIALASALVLVIGSAYYVSANAYTSLSQLIPGKDVEDDEQKMLAGTGAISEEAEVDVKAMELASILTTSKDEEPANQGTVCTEEPIEFTLYEVPVQLDDFLIKPSSDGDYKDGYYMLEADKVYAIHWDASPLYFNDDGEVRSDVIANSDFLIKEGGTGTITITLRDRHHDIEYTGELKIASAQGNLGIEFCADECRRRAYGFWPEIEDREFILCFYTSGEYVEGESNSITSVDGYYTYAYSVDGYEAEESSVTKPPRKPMPTTPQDDDQSTVEPPTETPDKAPDDYPVPAPVPTPDPALAPPVLEEDPTPVP